MPIRLRTSRIAMVLAAGLLAAVAAMFAVVNATAEAPPGADAPAHALCSRRAQARHADRCSQLGPSAEAIREREQDAISSMPLPTRSIDPDLSYLPFNYIRLSSEDPTWLYPTPQDARDGTNAYRALEPGFDFVSWIDCQIVDGKAIYMIEPGVYVRGGSDCSQIGTSNFHGLRFYRTPKRDFAWVLGGTYTSRQPGPAAPQTNHWVNRYELVYIHDQQQVGDFVWYRIGPDEWIEQRLVAVVRPDGTKPEDVEGDRWISIDLYEQTLSVYEQGELVYATLVSTGLRGWWTQPGTFQVYAKLDSDTMSGAFEADRSDYYYLEDVPWTLYYDQARAIHGAYWHNGFGYPRSHGC
ncbi:MAG: L,D-transpeptidase, partial [Anaerolineales bacterium]|nr:L,D-transpeptidase [Anaerolineales bacterium]